MATSSSAGNGGTVASVTRQWPDAHAEFECAAKQAPNKVQRRKHELHLRIRRWIKVESRRLRQMGLVFCASPNTSRQIRLAQIHLANDASTITCRQLRLTSRGLGHTNMPRRLYLTTTPTILHQAIRVSTTALR